MKPSSKSQHGRKRRILAVFGLVCGFSPALELRTYSPERHDRFTNYPDAPAFNDSAYYGSRKFTGVAWIPGEVSSRQFALVSPKHVVFATHFQPGPGTVLRFLNANGTPVDRTVSGVEYVLNGSSQVTDLCLVELSVPLAADDAVSHFPYLNLASEGAYVNSVLTVFGWGVRAGRSTVHGFENSNVEGINPTRVMRFRYPKFTGNQDDARVVGGDSGSPTFGAAGANPAIVGIHTANGESVTHHIGYDTFIPHYIAELDALMAPDGYRMTPAYPPSVTLTTTVVTPSPLKQAYAGSVRFDLANTGSNDAGNTRMTLHFAVETAPDSVTAPGWIAESTGPQDWVLRRANLAAGAVTEITASWTELPSVATIPAEISRVADGSPSASQTFQLGVAPTFKAWAAGLADETQSGDPDNDSVKNVLEYAFGGDPESGTMLSETGGALLPALTVESGQAILTFPSRDDREARGLSYTLEFSENLDGWSSTETPVLTDGTAPFDPVVPGFSLRTVSWDAADPRRFCRVRVTVTE